MASVAQGAAHLCEQLGGVEGFGEQLEPAILVARRFFKQDRGLLVPGNEKYFAGGQGREHLERRLYSRNARHDDIRNEHVRLEIRQQLHGGLTTVNCSGFVSGLFQDQFEGVGYGRLVVDDKHSVAGLAPRSYHFAKTSLRLPASGER